MDDCGFPFYCDRSVIPDDDDRTTLFMCSGMQRFKKRFQQPDRTKISTLQSCIRTNDIGLVGDGSHLTYFEMLGNFSFGGGDYPESVELWNRIVKDLRLPITSVHVHPDKQEHMQLWRRLKYDVVPDPDCTWSDGGTGGYCCELYCGDLEIGNLVNPYGHSVDVGFGLERMHQILERKQRVDQTSLFMQEVHPIVSDHQRAIEVLLENGIVPGCRGREYVLRRLVRRMLRFVDDMSGFSFRELLRSEQERREQSFTVGRKMLRKHGEKSDQFWWETFGILPEERSMLG